MAQSLEVTHFLHSWNLPDCLSWFHCKSWKKKQDKKKNVIYKCYQTAVELLSWCVYVIQIYPPPAPRPVPPLDDIGVIIIVRGRSGAEHLRQLQLHGLSPSLQVVSGVDIYFCLKYLVSTHAHFSGRTTAWKRFFFLFFAISLTSIVYIYVLYKSNLSY